MRDGIDVALHELSHLAAGIMWSRQNLSTRDDHWTEYHWEIEVDAARGEGRCRSYRLHGERKHQNEATFAAAAVGPVSLASLDELGRFWRGTDTDAILRKYLSTDDLGLLDPLGTGKLIVTDEIKSVILGVAYWIRKPETRKAAEAIIQSTDTVSMKAIDWLSPQDIDAATNEYHVLRDYLVDPERCAIPTWMAKSIEANYKALSFKSLSESALA